MQRRGAAGVSGTALKERPETLERKPGWAKPKPRRAFKGNPNRKTKAEGEEKRHTPTAAKAFKAKTARREAAEAKSPPKAARPPRSERPPTPPTGKPKVYKPRGKR